MDDEPTPKIGAGREFLQDLKDVVLEHLAASIMGVFIVLTVLIADVSIVVKVNDRLDTLQGNICQAVSAAAQGNVVQYEFWTAAANRAELRAKTESPDLAALDLDAAANDRRIAKVYAPQSHPYSFPGC